jgi:hypothetical protein
MYHPYKQQFSTVCFSLLDFVHFDLPLLYGSKRCGKLTSFANLQLQYEKRKLASLFHTNDNMSAKCASSLCCDVLMPRPVVFIHSCHNTPLLSIQKPISAMLTPHKRKWERKIGAKTNRFLVSSIEQRGSTATSKLIS